MDIDKGFKRTVNPKLEKIIAIRKRFREIVVGRPIGETYKILAAEFYDDSETIGAKVNLTGYYHKFKELVETEEKKRKKEIGVNPT
jgi:hypothetical protein